MKLSVRLTFLLISATVVTALVVGWFAVQDSTQSQYKVIDTEINAVIASGSGHPDEATIAALNVVQTYSYDLSLDVLDTHDVVTQVNAGNVPLRATPTLSDARHSLGGVTASSDLPGFRYRSERAAGGSYLVVAASTAAILRAARRLEINVALVGLLAALLSIGIAYVFSARDIRLIKRLINFASTIARGESASEIPREIGSPELLELRSSLVTMVGALQRAIDIERRASREMQRFIGDASHELRTPLTVIKGYSEILERPDLDEQMRHRALERVRREVVRMDTLVSDLLFITEVRESADLVVRRVALSDVLVDAVGNFREDHTLRTVELRVEPDVWILGREEYVERLINNALANIARHTPADAPVKVTLRVEATMAIILVDDGGPGMAPDAYQRDTKQFQRFDPTRSRESGGTGLGMSIMVDIVTTLRGEMNLGPSALGGLQLRFEIPTTPVPARDQNEVLA